jgi:ABC-type sugar transport system substrate-binding protein
MRRALMVVAASCLLALGSAACGDDDEAEPAGTSGDGQEQAALPEVEFTSIETDVPEGYDEPEPGDYRLAYLNPVQANEFLSTMGEAMRLETERLGGSMTELDAKGDVDTQVSQFNQLIAQDVDGIAVFALDPGSVAPAVERAREAGIELVTIDLTFDSTEDIGQFASQVWQRRDEAAYLGAQEMARRVGEGGQVATIDFAIKVPSIVYSIERGKHWAEQFGLELLGNASNPSDDIAGGQQAMTELLGKFPDMSGVIAYNDPSAIGAAAAARTQGKRDLVFGGQNGGSDALEAIKAGRQTYSARLDPISMGKAFSWGLYNLLEGKEVPKTVKAGPPEIVTEENVDQVKTWEQMLEEEYGG